eukprot:6131457-Amphidinium_carterae.1
MKFAILMVAMVCSGRHKTHQDPFPESSSLLTEGASWLYPALKTWPSVIHWDLPQHCGEQKVGRYCKWLQAPGHGTGCGPWLHGIHDVDGPRVALGTRLSAGCSPGM